MRRKGRGGRPQRAGGERSTGYFRGCRFPSLFPPSCSSGLLRRRFRPGALLWSPGFPRWSLPLNPRCLFASPGVLRALSSAHAIFSWCPRAALTGHALGWVLDLGGTGKMNSPIPCSSFVVVLLPCLVRPETAKRFPGGRISVQLRGCDTRLM